LYINDLIYCDIMELCLY